MNIFALIIFLIIAALLSVTLKKTRPEFSLLLTLLSGAVVLIYIFANVSGVLSEINDLISSGNFVGENLTALIKSLGITFAASFGADVCRDAGETSAANKIELGGKIAVLVICLPMFKSLLSIALDLINL